MKIVILLLVAYLLGSIPSGVWIGKLFFKKDIRQFGVGIQEQPIHFVS